MTLLQNFRGTEIKTEEAIFYINGYTIVYVGDR